MGERFYDFDAARAERLARPAPTLRAFGETVDLPRSIPAALSLTVAAKHGQPLTVPVLVEFLGYLAGWMAEHPDIEEDDLISLYVGARHAIQQRESEGEAPPPATGEPEPGSDGPTPPSTGSASRPTSPASTTSTSPEPSGTT